MFDIGVIEMEENKKMFLSNTNETAKRILKERYLQKDENGNVCETEEQMYKRVAKFVANGDKTLEKDFFEIMKDKSFMPNTPCLINAGAGSRKPQLSACFVLEIEDSMESIMNTAKDAAMIHKSGGGTGFSFSRLRPKDDVVSSTKGISSGPISFMKMYDTITGTIKQGGSRRGANLGCMRVDHPDILEFISCKDSGGIQNFNISVGITDKFIKAVEDEADFDLINPHTNEVHSIVKARAIWEKIVDSAWKTGDPGILFLDTINSGDETPELGEIETTNPCGEQPLHPYESCVLGHINLAKIVKDGKIDYGRLEELVTIGVHFLDNVIDVAEFPLEKIAETTRKSRRIGLGVMGFADMLLELGIQYGTKKCITVIHSLMSFIKKNAEEVSKLIASKKGEAPLSKNGMRNCGLLTIAPTGTTGIICDASSGIEPIFAAAYERHILDGNVFKERHKYLERLYKDKEDEYSSFDKFVDAVIENNGNVPFDSALVTASQVDYKDHIRVQAAFQEHVDSAISKTINMPNSATREDISSAYLLAFYSGCKGITVFRDGCRDSQVLVTSKKEQGKPTGRFSRPDTLYGVTKKVAVGCGELFVTINYDDDGTPRETFVTIGKQGGCAGAQMEMIGRVISLALKHNVPIDEIANQLSGIRCNNVAWGNGTQVFSCADGVSKIIKSLGVEVKEDSNNKSGACVICGSSMIEDAGCVKCTTCQYKSCSG